MQTIFTIICISILLYTLSIMCVSEGIKLLSHTDPNQRPPGLMALTILGGWTPPTVVKALVTSQDKARLIADQLSDSSVDVRIDALKVLAKLNPSIVAVHGETITKRLSSHDRAEMYWALYALLACNVEPHDSVIRDRLNELLQSSDSHNRLQGLNLLNKVDSEMLTKYEKVLVDLLVDTDHHIVRVARQQVCRILHLIVKRLDANSMPSRLGVLRIIDKLEVEDWNRYQKNVVAKLWDSNIEIRKYILELFLKHDLAELLILQDRFDRLLADEDDEVRRSAMRAIHNSQTRRLSPKHARAVLQRLEDVDEDIRLSALQVLSRIGSEFLSQHSDALLKCLDDTSVSVRRHVLDLANKLGPQALLPHAHRLLQMLGDPDVKVGELSLSILRSKPQILSAHAEASFKASEASLESLEESLKNVPQELWSFHESRLIVHLLKTSQQNIPEVDKLMRRLVNRMGSEEQIACFHAVPALRRMEGETLVKYKHILFEKLGAANTEIRKCVLDLLSKMRPSDLAEGADHFVEMLNHSDTYVRRKAVKILSKFEAGIWQPISEHVKMIIVLLDDADREARNAALSIVAKSRSAVLSPHLHLRLRQADTALHVAAAEGHLNACKALVSAGAPLEVQNDNGKTPVDVAAQRNHTDVFDFLDSQKHLSFTTVRGGTGDALQSALADHRRVVKVDWYTIPLTDWWAPALGLKHSLLTITVGDLGEPHMYVIEKAATQRSLLGSDDPVFNHGVYVSHWVDVSPKLGDPSKYSFLERPNLSSNVGGRALQMRTLIDIAVKLGPYDVGRCNCHHAAQAVYNACASPEYRMNTIPNQKAAWASSMLQTVGINPAESEIGSPLANGIGSFSHSASTNYKVGNFQVGSVDIRSIPWSSTAALLAKWIYLPRPGNMVSFLNRLATEIVVNVTGAPEELDLFPGQSGSIGILLEDVNVEIRRKGKVERCQVSRGQHYIVKRDLKDQVVCMQGNPLPEGVTSQFLNLAGGTSIVQWSLLTSEDALYVTFRGTAESRDMLVDLAVVTDDDSSHGLRVHGGMWNALNQRKHSVVRTLLEKIETLQNSSERWLNVVFCGHSLGGGYAILAALAMLHMGVNVSAVLAFGAPQVVVPDPNSAIWNALNHSTTLFINAYDAVPRLPACLDWLFDIAPKALLSFGAVTVNMTAYLKTSRKHLAEVLLEYDTVGSMVFLTEGSRSAQRVPSVSMSFHKEFLCNAPKDIHRVILRQHAIDAYASIIGR